MIRGTLLFVLLAALMIAVAWIADRPGAVSIVWQGWRVDTSLGVMLAAIVLVALVAAWTFRLWGAVIRVPRDFGRWRRERQRRRGYVALTQGLVAVAAGDPREARRHARRADVLLNEPPLTMLLSAQAAQLAGDEDQATGQFREMLKRPETEFLGVRGLLVQAMKTGDRTRALELARRARQLRPRTPWVLTTLFELETQSDDWQGGVSTLRQAARVHALPQAAARRHEAALLIEQSRAARVKGDMRAAVRLAEQAHRAGLGHPAAVAWLAETYVAAGKGRAAASLVEDQWARHPHPELLAAFRQARPVAEPLQWVKQVERLVRLAPLHRESLEALAAACLEAKLWGEARRHLNAAIKACGDQPSANLCRLMARLEEDENDDPLAGRRWLARAAEAPPDPAWVCDGCGAAHARWQAKCGRCSAFDRLEWRAPDRVAPALVGSGESGAPPDDVAAPAAGRGRAAGAT
ncbi:MAG TPA: heme biosynthesis HemY N-terminal domain-containing protein [Alphaproteobacteria bacterium]|nr:heme biosynthesis HemY N-terminal domain-containing protein [Alphaproteobacteria bacterium]